MGGTKAGMAVTAEDRAAAASSRLLPDFQHPARAGLLLQQKYQGIASEEKFFLWDNNNYQHLMCLTGKAGTEHFPWPMYLKNKTET